MAELLSIWEAALHDYRGSVDVENLTGLLDFLKCFHVHLSADGVEMRTPAVCLRAACARDGAGNEMVLVTWSGSFAPQQAGEKLAAGPEETFVEFTGELDRSLGEGGWAAERAAVKPSFVRRLAALAGAPPSVVLDVVLRTPVGAAGADLPPYQRQVLEDFLDHDCWSEGSASVNNEDLFRDGTAQLDF